MNSITWVEVRKLPFLTEAVIALIRDDDVVQDANPHDLPCFDQSARHTQIFATGCWIAAGVIMDEHKARSGLSYSRPENLSRVNQTRVERPFRDDRLPDDLIPTVEQ